MISISNKHVGNKVRIVYGTIGTATSKTIEVEGILQLICDRQLVISTPNSDPTDTSKSLNEQNILIISTDVIDHFEDISVGESGELFWRGEGSSFAAGYIASRSLFVAQPDLFGLHSF